VGVKTPTLMPPARLLHPKGHPLPEGFENIHTSVLDRRRRPEGRPGSSWRFVLEARKPDGSPCWHALAPQPGPGREELPFPGRAQGNECFIPPIAICRVARITIIQKTARSLCRVVGPK
jgi:hypothetical protein